jgi:GT2 family glycosyltransferase
MGLVAGKSAMTVGAQPVCTVCIANYNGESLLSDCIDSVLQQECDFAVEIIVHDDASTDRSLDLLATRYPQVKVIKSIDNVGFCISNNRMVAEATGQFILLLNNDAALARDALQTLYEHAKDQPVSGIVSLPQYDWESGELVDRGYLLDPFYNPVPNLEPSKREVAMVIGACLWIPRKAWRQLGGFPDWFESIAEDMQLCCRARLAGLTIEVTKGSGYRHRQGKSFGGNRASGGHLETTYRRRRLSERNKTFVLSQCTPAPLIWLLLPTHILALMTEGLFLAILKLDSKILREIYASMLISLIKNRKKIFKERKSIQQKRTVSCKTYWSKFTLRAHKLNMLMKYGIPRIR